MADIERRPTYGRGTRVSIRLDVESYCAPKPVDLIAEISAAMTALIADGVAAEDISTSMEIDCDRDGHEVRMEVYGYRPATKAESAKVRRDRNEERKKQAEWHRAMLARLEES